MGQRGYSVRIQMLLTVIILLLLTGLALGQGRFSKSGSVITDSVTGLQWRVGPDSDIDWFDARDWVSGLGGGWRMPTLSELETLFDGGITDESWGHFRNSGYCVWSSETRGSSSAYLFDFHNGYDSLINSDGAYYQRAFAVRSR